MGVKTSAEYRESLKGLRPEVYIAGERVEDLLTNPYLKASIDETCTFYDWANQPDMRDDFRFFSPLINEDVSFWTYLRQSKEDMYKHMRVMKKNNARNLCSMCMTLGSTTMWAPTYEIDQAHGTKYHERFKAFLKRLQKEDKRCALGIMDPKGDRSKAPHEQADPDLFLRIVDRTPQGIYVNGAKAQTTNAPISHYYFAAPSRVLTEKDRDYAVAFVTPIDTKGLKFITRPSPCPLTPSGMTNPASMRHSFVESLSVFDNVFIPWENVFMCGEWEFTASFIKAFAGMGRLTKCICTSARTDILIGAASLIADYNGVSRAGHIKHKINDMMIASEIGRGCVHGAIANSSEHASGVWQPEASMASAGLYHTRLKFVEFLGCLMEIAGGAITTMPVEADLASEITGDLMRKYFAAAPHVSAEDRLKLLYFIQELTASRFGGYFLSSAICAVGTPETNRLEVLWSYDLAEKIANVKRLCNIM